MKILRIKASNYKNCVDDFCIDFVAKAKKSEEDKEYELQKIDEELYVYNTVAIIGKNASGKTSAIELLDCCYDILSTFRVEGSDYNYDGVKLEIVFYDDGYIYKYNTALKQDVSLDGKVCFENQELSRKKYYKTKLKNIYSDEGCEMAKLVEGNLPEDISIVFFALKKQKMNEVYYKANTDLEKIFSTTFVLMKIYKVSDEVLQCILKIFDENIDRLVQKDENNYIITYRGKEKVLSSGEVIRLLSSGTVRGLNLYLTAYASLKYGFDLLVDEIENHHTANSSQQIARISTLQHYSIHATRP